MRFLIAATTDPDKPKAADTEPPFDRDLFAAYMKFNEDMHKAGVLVASEGINPGVKGARIGISGGKRVVLDGPFAESKELIGGFYLIEVASREEAIEWALRCPTGLDSADVLTIHPMTEESDIPAELLKLTRDVAPEWSATWKKRK
jgi:hypothetical protein